jgi:hypothetical protein
MLQIPLLAPLLSLPRCGDGDDIVCALVWKDSGEHKQPEFLGGVDVRMILYFLGRNEVRRKGLGVEGLAGESFFHSPFSLYSLNICSSLLSLLIISMS